MSIKDPKLRLNLKYFCENWFQNYFFNKTGSKTEPIPINRFKNGTGSDKPVRKLNRFIKKPVLEPVYETGLPARCYNPL